jgi:hypothetical protein
VSSWRQAVGRREEVCHLYPAGPFSGFVCRGGFALVSEVPDRSSVSLTISQYCAIRRDGGAFGKRRAVVEEDVQKGYTIRATGGLTGFAIGMWTLRGSEPRRQQHYPHQIMMIVQVAVVVLMHHEPRGIRALAGAQRRRHRVPGPHPLIAVLVGGRADQDRVAKQPRKGRDGGDNVGLYVPLDGMAHPAHADADGSVKRGARHDHWSGSPARREAPWAPASASLS